MFPHLRDSRRPSARRTSARRLTTRFTLCALLALCALSVLCLTACAGDSSGAPATSGTITSATIASDPTTTGDPTASDPTASDTIVTDPSDTDPAAPAESTGETTVPALTIVPETTAAPETLAPELPRLDIATEGGAPVQSKEQYVRASATLSGCGPDEDFADRGLQIRIRGNSTAGAPKKPYRLKFDEKQAMAGLNRGRAYRDWCLMADYFDGSMLRTFGTFRMAAALMQGQWYSADARHVEVYLNGRYEGVYLLCEQTEIQPGRVAIPKRPAGSTVKETGYLMIGQGGRSDEPDSIVIRPDITVRDRNGQEMYFGALNFALSGNNFTEEQKTYVSRYASGVFRVVAAAVYEDRYYNLSREGKLTPKHDFQWAKTREEKQIETVEAVFDIDSAVRMCILDEIVKNLDAMTFNMYVDLSPAGDGVLTLAAPWDFDFSMANTHYATTHSPTGFYATNLSVSEGMRTNLWFVMLGRIGWFEERIKAVWQADYDALLGVIGEMGAVNHQYDAAFDRDYEVWGRPADRQLIHHHDQNDLRLFKDHEQAGQFVVDWLRKRVDWLNRQWGDPATFPPEPKRELIFDGTDPAIGADFSEFRRCTGKWTKQGFRLAPDASAYDPYVNLDIENRGRFTGEAYPYLEITYMIPASAAFDRYNTELFLCAGGVETAQGGISTSVETVADGRFHTVKIDLASTGYWSGDIHRVRLDFFSECAAGDAMFIREIRLFN